MQAQLFVRFPDCVSHVRLGSITEAELLIKKAYSLPHLFPYVTDLSLKTLWVHPDSIKDWGHVPDCDSTPRKPRIARQRRAKRFPGTLTAAQALSLLQAL